MPTPSNPVGYNEDWEGHPGEDWGGNPHDTEFYTDNPNTLKTTSSIVGIWYCSTHDQNNNSADNFNSILELNSDMTFRYGQYGNLDNNHYSGTYTFSEIELNDEIQTKTNVISKYKIHFSTDEAIFNGQPYNSSSLSLSDLDMSITKTSAHERRALIKFSPNALGISNEYDCYEK